MNRNRKKKSKQQKQIVTSHPPQLRNHNIKWTTRLRFMLNANTPFQGITDTQILNTVIIAGTAVLGYQMFNAARVKFIELWALPAVGGTPQTITCTFDGTGGDSLVFTDTSMGIEPCHVRAKPRRDSLAALWFNTSSTQLFTVGGPANMILDLGIEFVNIFALPTAATNALIAAGPGSTYLRGLDGLAIASTSWIPQGGFTNI